MCSFGVGFKPTIVDVRVASGNLRLRFENCVSDVEIIT